MASQEAIKELGTNGGGFFNANPAHPFENPTTWTNWIEIFLMLVILFAAAHVWAHDRQPQGLCDRRRDGGPRADQRQPCRFQFQATAPSRPRSGRRWKAWNSASASPIPVFADATTLTSTGAVDSFHDSYTSLAG